MRGHQRGHQKLFMVTDPVTLDRYEKTDVPRRVEATPQAVRQLDLFRRALQSLPPRELKILYTTQVLKVGQEDASALFSVRQSNISYRKDRSTKRIALLVKARSIISESKLRRKLFNIGMEARAVEALLGVTKTFSQRATAEAFELNQGSIRGWMFAAIEKFKTAGDEGDAESKKCAEFLQLVVANYNQARAIRPQARWQDKVGDTLYTQDK